MPRLTIPAAASRYGRRRSPEPDCWLDVPLSLRSTVERLDGADGRPMLFVADRAAYVRLTPGAARLVGRLDGTATGNQLADQISRPAGAGAGEVRRSVVAVLDALRSAGALTVAAAAPPETGFLTGSYRRIPLTRSVHRAVRPVAALLRAIPVPVAAAAMAATVAASTALVVAAVAGATAPTGGVLVVLAVVAVQVVVHEAAHAVACAAAGVPAREAGIVAWGLVLPVPYVDCTDAYRLRGRWRRAGIALAGPYVDVLAVGVSAAAALAGWPVRGLVLAQLLVLAITLNPLLPGDGSHVAAILAGEPHLRGRALAALTGRRLPAMSRARRTGYRAYGLFAVGAFLATAALAGYTVAVLT